MRHGLASGVLFAFIAGSTTAMAGVVVTATQTKLDTRQASAMTVYVDTDRIKVVTPEMIAIFRGDLNRMWAIDPQRGTYMEMTQETMQRMGGQMAQLSAAQAQLQAALAQLPPEQRAQMEAMMAGRGGLGGPPGGRAGGPPAPPQITYAKSGGSKMVAGMSCDLYSKTINGQKEGDLCIAPVSAARLAASDFQVMNRFSTFMAPIMSSPMIPKNEYMTWNEMNKAVGFQGMPLDTVIYAGGRPDRQQTVNKIERTAISAGTFDLPPGLTKQDVGGPR